MGTPLYDDFSADYDRFVKWDKRLEYELPFIERQLKAVDARRVLDVACGTGRHALALAERGYHVTGTDVSAGMIEQARENANARGLSVHFVVAGFGQLRHKVTGEFDALLCLGSSLPHISSPATLAPTLKDFAAVLRPGGLALIQNRNFDLVLKEKKRWMPPQSYRAGESEWLFLRLYDFNPDGSISFNVMTLHREGDRPWQQRVSATQLWPLGQDDLLPALEASGFEQVACYGSMDGKPFARETSPNLIVSARKSAGQPAGE